MKSDNHSTDDEKKPCCLTRREFLLGSGVTVATTIVLSAIPGFLRAENHAALQVVGYPRKRIAEVGALKKDKPVDFQYPHNHPNCAGFIVKLGEEASSGVGPDKDIVAFNSLCPHMGGSLAGLYKGTYKAIGPCPFHLSVFDLRRHGMVVSGHATESLPQVVLEIEGNDIYATGVMGLIYGFADNKVINQGGSL